MNQLDIPKAKEILRIENKRKDAIAFLAFLTLLAFKASASLRQ